MEVLMNLKIEGSLEEIFNKITGFTEHEQLAEEFVKIVQGE